MTSVLNEGTDLLQEVMARPAAPEGPAGSQPAAHHEAHTQALAAGSATPGAHR
ncbi:hypothetical protein [Streptomyces sp. NPDC040750]|uniref:hypothetical protein n=1 Tax=Streptomyces sp. NPDC040750 TaxID=3154491 RepID=UPI0033CD3FC1